MKELTPEEERERDALCLLKAFVQNDDPEWDRVLQPHLRTQHQVDALVRSLASVAIKDQLESAIDRAIADVSDVDEATQMQIRSGVIKQFEKDPTALVAEIAARIKRIEGTGD